MQLIAATWCHCWQVEANVDPQQQPLSQDQRNLMVDYLSRMGRGFTDPNTWGGDIAGFMRDYMYLPFSYRDPRFDSAGQSYFTPKKDRRPWPWKPLDLGDIGTDRTPTNLGIEQVPLP